MGRQVLDVLFLGYFGYGNLGDEILLETLATGLRAEDPDLRLGAYTGPEGLSPGASSMVHAMERSSGPTMRRAPRLARVLCVGPGGIFQDSTSVASCAWYAAQVWRARRAGTAVVHVGQSLGPLKSLTGRLLTRWAMGPGDPVVLRDEPSLDVAAELGLDPVHAADVAWMIEPTEQVGANDRPAVALAPRRWDAGRTGQRWWAKLRSGLEAAGIETVWLAMAPDDARLAEDAERLMGREPVGLRAARDTAEALGILARCSAVVGMRLHALILAAVAGAAPLGISYDPKVDGLLGSLGREALCTAAAPWDPARVVSAVENGPEPVPQPMVEHQRRRAQRNVAAIMEALAASPREEPESGR
jgi:polysaccharide pyruvyl transferase CsaB